MSRFRMLMAAGAALGLVFALALPAHAGVVWKVKPRHAVTAAYAPAGVPVYSTADAGYQAGPGSWHYRFVTAAAVLPDPSAALDSDGDTMNATVPDAGFGADLANASQDIGIGISWGGSAWNVNVYQSQPGNGGYNCNNGGGTEGVNCSLGTGFANGNEFAPGTRVTLSLYYSTADDSVQWTVSADGRQVAQDYIPGSQVWNEATQGGGSFSTASAGLNTGGSFTAPDEDFRLLAVSNAAVTSYDGTRGSFSGHWPASEDVATGSGTGAGAVMANAPVLYNEGTQFGIWLRAGAAG